MLFALPVAAQLVTGGADPRLIASVRQIAERCETIRGGTFAAPPMALRAPAADRAALAERRVAETLPAARLAARGRAWEDLGLGFSEAPATLLGLLAGDLDGVAVDAKERVLLVDPDRLTPQDFLPEEAGEEVTTLLLATGVRPDEPVVAHALTHLLQVERTGPDSLPDTTDELLASTALAEGEANLVAVLYLFRAMGLGDDVLEAGLDPGLHLEGALVPAAIESGGGTANALADFVYREGFARVVEAYGGGGWAAVDRLLQRRSATRDVLHPDRAPGPPFHPVLPDVPVPESHALRDEDTLGEQAIVALVARATGKDNLGLLAGDGWAGGALFRWEPEEAPEDGITAWVTRWDSEEDAGDFVYAYGRALRARFGTQPATPPEGVWVRSGTAKRPVAMRRVGLEVVVWISAPPWSPSPDTEDSPESVRPDD